MKDKTKEQLTAEIELLRREVAELEQEKAERKWAGRLLQALNQASRSTEQALTPEEIFSAVKGQLKKLGFSSAVFLTDESQKRLFLKYWSYETAAIRTAEKLAGHKHEDFPILIETVDVYRKTVWERETVFVEDVKDVIEQLFQAVLPGPAKKLAGSIAKILKVSKDINAPLIVGNKVVGMLSVQSGDLTADDIPAITAFAHQMAAAWYKATLLQDLKRSLAERKRAEETLQKTHDDLERRVEERTAELLKSNEQLTQEISERKRAEKTLRGSEEKYRNLFQNARDIIVTFDLKGNVTSINKAVAEYGYKEDEFVGKNMLKLVSKKYWPRLLKELAKIVQGKPIEGEIEITTPQGGKIAEYRSNPIREGKKVIGFQTILRDISERKRAEEKLRASEQNFRSSLDNSPLGIRIVSAEGETLYVNQVILDIYGYSSLEELEAVPRSKRYTPESYVEHQERKEKRKLGKFVPPHYEISIVRKDGEVRQLQVFRREVMWGGKTQFQVIYLDITEQKKAGEELQRSEGKYRALFESKLDGVFVLDAETMRVVLANQAAVEMYGFNSVEEVIGVNPLDSVVPEERERALKIMVQDMFEKNLHHVNEFRTITKDGKEKWISAVGTRIEYEGKLAGLISFRDITEQKEARNRLEELEALESSILGAVPHAVIGLHERRIVFASEGVEAVFGWKPEELIGKTTRVLYRSEEEYEEIARRAYPVLERQQTYSLEFPCRRKDGRDIICLVSDSRIGESLKERRIVVTYEDITERKQAEEELRSSEERLKILFEFAPDAYYLNDLKGNFIDGNKAAEEITGYKREELIGNSFLKLKLLPPKQVPKAVALLAKNVLGQPTGPDEFTLNRKDGSQVSVEIRTFPVRIKEQTLVLGIAHDITERKKAEEEIKYQRKYFQALFDSSPEAVVSLDPQNLIVNINPAFEKIFGYTLEDIKGKDIDDCIIPRNRKKEGRSLSRRTWVGEVVVAESVRKKADGGEIPVSILGAPIMIGDKRVGMFAIYRDITERKKAQEQLERSFIDLAETVSRAMSSRDPYTASHQRRVAELARLVGEKMGLDKNRLQGLQIGGLLHDIGKISTPGSILSKPGDLAEEEWGLIHAHAMRGYEILDGSRFPWPVAEMALHHHERLDGSGYPHGISGDKLSLEVRILGVCDVVEAMSSFRPYRPARSLPEILKELRSGKGTKYDANVVDVMLEIIEGEEFELQGSGNRRL